MALTLRQLKIFLAVADNGSTVAAADAVSLSQSAVSTAISELERQLATSLFDRVGARLMLNADGRELVRLSRDLLHRAEWIERQYTATTKPQKTPLRLAASTTVGKYLMPRLLARYRDFLGDAGDDIVDRTIVMIANSSEVVAAVSRFDADAGFVDYASLDASVQAEHWFSEELVIVAAPFHPVARLAGSGELQTDHLRRARWLLREVGSGTRAAVEHALAERLGQLIPGLELGDSEAIKHAVIEGLGLSCLPRLVVADALESGKLVEIRMNWPQMTRQFSVISHRDRALSAGLQHFIEYCRAKPIRLVVSYPAGGNTDQIARILGVKLTGVLGQPVIVENRPFVGGTRGMTSVNKDSSNETVLYLVDVSHAMLNGLHQDPPCDLVREYLPVSQIARGANILVIRPDLPVSSVSELISYAKENPGRLRYGCAGTGTSPHLAAELLVSLGGIELTRISYNGLAPATGALLDGRIDLMIGGIAAALPYIRSGKLRPLAVTSRDRLPSIPDWPTLRESGMPDYDLGTWFGVVASLDTPDDRIDKISNAIDVAMNSGSATQILSASGLDIVTNRPSVFGKFLNDEVERWRKLAVRTKFASAEFRAR